MFLVLERLDGAGVVLQAEGHLALVLHALMHLTQVDSLNTVKGRQIVIEEIRARKASKGQHLQLGC